jgi:hypothetical protein
MAKMKKTKPIGKLTQFLMQISANKKAWERFKKDPDAAMADAQLTPSQIAAIKSNDPARLRRAVSREFGKIPPPRMNLMVAIVIVDLDL